MSQPRRSIRKKRQTQLSFTPLPSSSPAASQYPEQIARRAASVRYGESPTKKQRVAGTAPTTPSTSPATSPSKLSFTRQEVGVVVRTPQKEASQLPTPVASSQSNGKEIESHDGEIPRNGEIEGPATDVNGGNPILEDTTTTDTKNAGLNIPLSSSEDDITPVRSGRRSRPAPILLSSDEGSDLQIASGPFTPSNKPHTQSRSGKNAVKPSDDSDSDSTAQLIPRRTFVSPKTPTNGERSQSRVQLLNGKPTEATPPEAGKALVISSGESSSEDEVVTPARRRRSGIQSADAPAKEVSIEQDDTDDLDDEVADLDDDAIEIRKNRTRGRQDNSERSKRQRKLEELRQRRAGIRADTDEDNGEDSFRDASESEPESIDYAMRRTENLDEYEDDFVDDDDDTVGVDLGSAGIPLQFTRHANKKPFEHFKTEVEWIVQNKLNPAFDRYDEIYLLAHDKLDKEVEGYGSSKFSSSVWKERFVNALKTRPDFYRIDVPTMHEHKCDACQRSNHPPKHKVIFTGKPYNRETLETIENEDDDDDNSSDDEEGGPSGSNGPEDENFFLGRFCCANAEMAHALRHWRYSLSQTVLQWLADDGQLTPQKIIARDNLRQKKRQKEANKVVDDMEETGVMRDLYRQFKENLEAARDAKPKHFSNRH